MSGTDNDDLVAGLRERGIDLDEALIPKNVLEPDVPLHIKDMFPDPEVNPEAWAPKLWDARPDSVTHIAGAQLSMFGRYLRQRCEWCGVILVEYDLARLQVPVGQEGPPAMWPVGGLVRVDGHMSAEVESVDEAPGLTKLPMDSCAFDPETQVS